MVGTCSAESSSERFLYGKWLLILGQVSYEKGNDWLVLKEIFISYNNNLRALEFIKENDFYYYLNPDV